MDYLIGLRTLVKKQKPLIHCLTNNITINDVANVILAVGARPIMAEHKDETANVTSSAKALAVNLGNITDDRMRSMMLSGSVARKEAIPCVIDLVGVACSSLRLQFAQNFIKKCRPTVIKGNASELKALDSLTVYAQGVDVTSSDATMGTEKLLALAQRVSAKYDAIVVITGKTDVVVHGNKKFLVQNGHAMLAEITGTGCMLNGLIATFISSGDFLHGSLLATSMLSVCGELAAQTSAGTGSFKVALLDQLYSIDDEKFSRLACITEQL